MSGGDQLSTSLIPSIDPLTGAHDRKTLLSMLFRETDRAQRMKTALCLLLIGVEVAPDTFPHPSAPIYNELLRQIATGVSWQLRSYDLVGRIAERAFVAVLPGCDAADAASLAGRICSRVFANHFVVGCNAIQLIPRFGIAMSEGRSPVVVLREAEQALRKANERGPAAIYEFGCQGAADSMSPSEVFAAPRNS